MKSASTTRQDTMKSNRQKHTAPFKAQVALEAMREQSTVAEIGRRYKINPNLVHKWKKEAVARLATRSRTRPCKCRGIGERRA